MDPSTPPSSRTCITSTSRAGSSTGRGFSTTAFTRLKMTVVAPIPRAIVVAATTEKVALRRS
jgi:hypothetical protein